MKLTITCQTCAKTLAIIEKDQISQDDISMYEEACFCGTIQSIGVDDNGDPLTVYDGQTNIQATMTVE